LGTIVSLSLLASALVSPLGPAAVAAAALRGGLTRANTLEWAPTLGYGDDAAPTVGHAAIVAPTDDLARITALLAALPTPPTADSCLVVLPLPSPTRQPTDLQAVVTAWAAGIPLTTLELGHAGFAAAMVEAGRRQHRVLILAIESLLGAAALDWLHADERLRGPDTAFALAPGEAAAWWLVAPTGGRATIHAGWVASNGRRAPADDAERWWAAAQQAGLDPARPRWDLVDLTGEPWRDRVWGGLAPQLSEAPSLFPAAHWGDLGAASAAAAGCAALAWRGERPATRVVWSLSEDGSAGVVAMTPGDTPAA
jgi:hypothetical protein